MLWQRLFLDRPNPEENAEALEIERLLQRNSSKRFAPAASQRKDRGEVQDRAAAIGESHVAHAKDCLTYTMATNRNVEQKIHRLILLSSAALAGSTLQLEKASTPSLFIVAALLLLLATIYGIWALRPILKDPNSRMLPEWIAKQGRLDYLTQCTRQECSAIFVQLVLENHALASVTIRRTKRYRRQFAIFFIGGLAFVGAYVLGVWPRYELLVSEMHAWMRRLIGS